MRPVPGPEMVSRHSSTLAVHKQSTCVKCTSDVPVQHDLQGTRQQSFDAAAQDFRRNGN
jgi:hypothetical protein